MRKYELSISADYVPEWGVVEATREFFQNSIDEQTRDGSNKMFFNYDSETQVMRIGNKHSDLDIKTRQDFFPPAGGAARLFFLKASL